jgi:integrase
MSDEIKVTVVDYGKKHLMLRYIDPMTGKQKHRSAGTALRKDAIKAAGKWEAELREGRYAAPINMAWSAFRERYEDEVLSALAIKTDAKVSTVFNSIEKIVSPKKLADLTPARLSHYQAKLREVGRSESTIKGHLSHLKAALSWATKMGLLPRVPTISMPKRAKGQKVMKGRPITGEEFDRMLGAVSKVVGETAAPSWRYYLRGLWWAGLRLAESLELYWDRDDKLCVDLSGKHPMLRIPAALEKGHRDRLLPLAPEFAEMLLQTPTAARTGRIFNLYARRVCGDRLGHYRVSELLAEIGKRAGVKVNTDQAGKVKFASAHDLRRSFGERWAARIMPQQLMELMRHESIDTTMRFYVGRNAQSTASVLWDAYQTKEETRDNPTVEVKSSRLSASDQ